MSASWVSLVLMSLIWMYWCIFPRKTILCKLFKSQHSAMECNYSVTTVWIPYNQRLEIEDPFIFWWNAKYWSSLNLRWPFLVQMMLLLFFKSWILKLEEWWEFCVDERKRWWEPSIQVLSPLSLNDMLMSCSNILMHLSIEDSFVGSLSKSK